MRLVDDREVSGKIVESIVGTGKVELTPELEARCYAALGLTPLDVTRALAITAITLPEEQTLLFVMATSNHGNHVQTVADAYERLELVPKRQET